MQRTAAEIIKMASEGDTNAFRQLVDENQRFVILLARRFVADPKDAEDIAQEVFVKLWRNLKRYTPEIKLTTWLYTIVTNQCLDFLKSKHNKKKKLHDSVEDHYALKESMTTEQAFHEKEFALIVGRMSELLTPKQRAVFILRDLEGLELQEVSAILSMSSGNVKSNLYYARKQLSLWLKKYYQEQTLSLR